MQIDEAIRTVRCIAEQKRAFAATFRAHPFIDDERHVQRTANQAEREAKAMETVCDTLEGFLRKQEEDNSYHSK